MPKQKWGGRLREMWRLPPVARGKAPGAERIPPVGKPPKPPPPDLKDLQYAEPARALIEKGRYEEARKALSTDEPTPDEENNLGCVYAWLAYTEDDPSYWKDALDVLRRSHAAAGDDDAKRRAKENLALVRKVRDGA